LEVNLAANGEPDSAIAPPASRAESAHAVDGKRALPMWAAAWIVGAILILSNAPTPLYVHWQGELGFSSTMLTALFSAYIVGLIASLAISGQCADHFGLRAVLLPGLACAALGCLLFAWGTSVRVLLLARFASGIAVGAATTAGISAVIELAGKARRAEAAVVASSALVFGAALGPLLAGGFASAVSNPAAPTFFVELILLGTAAVVATRLGSPVRSVSPTAWRPHLPSVPAENKRHLACGIAAFGCGLSGTAFILSLGPSVLADINGEASPLVAGGMACLMFLTGTLLQIPAGRLPVYWVFALSIAGLMGAAASTSCAVLTAEPTVLMAGAIFSGAGHGLAQLAGLTLISQHVAAERRAEANAVFNIGGYVPCGVVPLVTGALTDRIGLTKAVTCFACALAIAAIAAAIFILRNITRVDERPSIDGSE
jgi:MFS family permease